MFLLSKVFPIENCGGTARSSIYQILKYQILKNLQSEEMVLLSMIAHV